MSHFVSVTAAPSSPPNTTLCAIEHLVNSGESIVLKQYWSSTLTAPPSSFPTTSAGNTTKANLVITLIWSDVCETQTVVNSASSGKIIGDGNAARLIARLSSNNTLYPENDSTTAKIDDVIDTAALFPTFSSKETKAALKALNQSIDKSTAFYCGNTTTLADFALWAALINTNASLPSNIKAWKKSFDENPAVKSLQQ
eukprot:m.44445 g.44445  ORF g.44445 m.44445 type:complete len:198 (-) comp10609_c0_seq1:141-734(-)